MAVLPVRMWGHPTGPPPREVDDEGRRVHATYQMKGGHRIELTEDMTLPEIRVAAAHLAECAGDPRWSFAAHLIGQLADQMDTHGADHRRARRQGGR